MRVALVALLCSVPAFAQQSPDDPEWDPDRPLEAQRESDEARTLARLSISAGFGLIGDPGVSGSGQRLGPSFAVAVPFWMGSRRPYNQFVLEARAGAGWVPNRYALVELSPMWGVNLYFGKYVGYELRLGAGFAAQLSSLSHFGLAFRVENGIVLRVFSDDRIRLKVLGGTGLQIYFDQRIGGTSVYLAAGFETVL